MRRRRNRKAKAIAPKIHFACTVKCYFLLVLGSNIISLEICFCNNDSHSA